MSSGLSLTYGRFSYRLRIDPMDAHIFKHTYSNVYRVRLTPKDSRNIGHSPEGIQQPRLPPLPRTSVRLDIPKGKPNSLSLPLVDDTSPFPFGSSILNGHCPNKVDPDDTIMSLPSTELGPPNKLLIENPDLLLAIAPESMLE